MYGKNLKNERKMRNITQKELAKATGISQQIISDYEKDKVIASITNIVLIADYYKISIDELIGREIIF